MIKKEYRLKKGQNLTIIPLSDLHLGSEQFNQEYFEYSLKQIEEIEGQKRIYLVGDLIEHASKTVGNSAYHTTMTLDDQIETVIDYLKPFKDDIVFTCRGNHELRSSKDYDLDITRLIAQSLGTPYGHQYIDCFRVSGKPFNVYLAHGKGSSAHHYTAQSKIIRETAQIQADLYLNGHNHRCGHFSLPHRKSDGLSRKHYAFTGAFLRYNGYPDMMQLPVLPEAFLHLRLDRDLILTPELFYIDERRPDLMEI